MLSTLARTNLLKPTKELDNFLREKYGLPVLPDDYQYIEPSKEGKGMTPEEIEETIQKVMEDQEQ